LSEGCIANLTRKSYQIAGPGCSMEQILGIRKGRRRKFT
jgi:hypothetical protein